MTKLERATRRAIREWCEDQGYTVKKIHHVTPRAYIVAKPAIKNLVVSVPPCDAPELSSGSDLSSATILHFDPHLKAGDWCSTAYIITEAWWGGWVAIPAVVVED